ncbi:TPA: hypothetical protein N0F65_002928 [Lagenidium giganteum]|uniref:RING-type domain-containing protein n=1 Tax=Lagenidium giganteum TaxID=4803 RepID=A0AAV2Z8R8_9STRA|nr:TPA: hypothetical protein N0F65_002928 [Lagenidium giganteum]
MGNCVYAEEQVLWQAAKHGDVRVLQIALSRLTGAKRKFIEWQEPCRGRTALAEAAAAGHVGCVQALVAAGALCNTKDHRGNTPLHLACKHGHVETVKLLLRTRDVFAFATNLAMCTPLDAARVEHAQKAERRVAFGLVRCIEELEKMCCVHTGWLYEKTDNALSMVSGMSSLNLWRRRLCIVLQRGVPDMLELALFTMRPGEPRPVTPSKVIIYDVINGMIDVTDSKWFNRKDNAFSVRGHDKTKHQFPAMTPMRLFEFAPVDSEGYAVWKCFFQQHQQAAASAAGVAVPLVLSPPVHTAERRGCGMTPDATGSSLFGCLGSTRTRLESPIDVHRVDGLVADDEVEEEDDDLLSRLRKLLQPTRKRRTTKTTVQQHESLVTTGCWEMEDDDDDDLLEGLSCSLSPPNDLHRAMPREPSPMVNYGPALCFPSSLGECIVCYDGPQVAVCVPCGHNAVCMACAEEILDTTCECPVCRAPIRELIKLYLTV